MTPRPWREIAIPHPDVLEGTFQQAEFAADITAVRNGTATREYQDPVAFFQRTFITEGMRNLLVQVAQRLNGKGGDPVIQLQTAFGGGKTHTMLGVYHLATRKVPLSDLAGVSDVVDHVGLMDVPQARVAVIDGNARSPGQSWQYGTHTIRTLWGDLAWQLGGESTYALLKESDENGTSPGKQILKRVLESAAPCVILVDELVAYVRQFAESKVLSGGSFDSNLSFMQALTEAVKLVPTAILLASLPESEVEAGSQRGIAALRALEKTFGRVQALWKPVATEEAFEIVRRRLFESVRDEQARDMVCRAFADTYIAEGAKLPSETQEARYADRLLQAYPIHPEVFDRLYEDWTTIDGFQRTRGVLKLMAKVIYRLWKDENKDAMIMPGSLPLYDGSVRSELNYYLPGGWDAVIEKDIDGERAETTELENKETRFGGVNAARRVARTLYLGSAPASMATQSGVRGLDRARILLGCLQPEQPTSIYLDALSRLSDRLHYLNSSGDKTQASTRYWFDTRANLRREMEERKQRFTEDKEVRSKLRAVLDDMVRGNTFFDGVHSFTPHVDVPDDAALRLVILPPTSFYLREEPRPAENSVVDYVRNHGLTPRHRGNRLLFLAADQNGLGRLRDVVRVALAWDSIVTDVKEGRLNIDQLQKRQAEKERADAEAVVPRAVRECYRWLLCPVQHTATDKAITIEAFVLNTGGSTLGSELERQSLDNELVITTWSPIHLRTKLRELYWKTDRPAVKAMSFWEDTLRYLFLPRLKHRNVLEQAIIKGAGSRDFFGTAFGVDGDRFEGFKFADANVHLDDTLLLIEPERAADYEQTQSVPKRVGLTDGADETGTKRTNGSTKPDGVEPPVPVVEKELRRFIGTAEVNAATAKMRLMDIADEIISLLASDPQVRINITLEIHAEFSGGVSDKIKRDVSENATQLGFKNKTWE